MSTIRNSLGDLAYRAFVDHVRNLRKASGVTQLELAAKLRQPQSYVSKTERYERRMDAAEFRAWIIGIGGDPTKEFATVAKLLDAEALAMTDADLLASTVDDG